MNKFAKKYNLGNPIAGNSYLLFHFEVEEAMNNYRVSSFLLKVKPNHRFLKK